MGRLRYLVDTNIWLEILLSQEKAKEAEEFLKSIPADLISITDFSLYSIGIILDKLEKSLLFKKFLTDIENTSIEILRLEFVDLKKVLNTMKKFNLDFDDAYQYAVAEKYDLRIVSFDKDFDKTEKGRFTPKEALKKR